MSLLIKCSGHIFYESRGKTASEGLTKAEQVTRIIISESVFICKNSIYIISSPDTVVPR